MYITSINQYTTISQIGKGAFGDITLATDQNSNCYAIKKITKTKKQADNILREVKAGKMLKHKNVVKFVEHLQDDEHDYLVFEYVHGHDLFSYLEKKRKFVPFSECEARVIIRQLAQVLLFCHANGVIHLDVKLDNIMFEENSFKVTLIDFGLSDFVTPENQGRFRRRCGSAEYCAAEILQKRGYDVQFDGPKLDVYSLGVVLYSLLSSTFPFDAKKRMEAASNGEEHPVPCWGFDISDEARDLICRMIEPEPQYRISMQEVLQHPWFTNRPITHSSM